MDSEIILIWQAKEIMRICSAASVADGKLKAVEELVSSEITKKLNISKH